MASLVIDDLLFYYEMKLNKRKTLKQKKMLKLPTKLLQGSFFYLIFCP